MKITLTNISKSFGGKRVIRPTSLVVESGSFTTLLGPSGCGKTTLLRIIAGLETPDTCEIRFDDRVVYSAEGRINVPPEKRGLGFVFQDFALWPHMSVYENVAFGLRAARNTKWLDEKVRAALHAVQLDEFAARYPHQLSGGQQQRVAFARAIVIEPQCILFDEPLSALDALLREEMRTELKELISRLGITAVFVTHDQIEAMSMSDKIAVLNGGTVEQYDSPEEIYSAPATRFAARFIGASDWIDGERMFRPETAHTSPCGGAEEFTARVVSAQFMGGSYQTRLECGGQPWTLITSERMQVGTQVSIYIKKEDIITVSLLKKSILPAYAGFEITFLPRASRGKKLIYPRKCVRDAALTQPCAQCGCPVGKPPYGGFSTV